MSAKQLAVLVIAMSILAAGLAWGLQRVELNTLHAEIRGYLDNVSKFRAAYPEEGPSGE